MPNHRAPVVLRTHVDVLALIPYVLGVHPEREIVVLSLDAGRFTRRARTVALDQDSEDIARQIVTAAILDGDDELWLIGYGPHHADEQVSEVAALVHRAVRVTVRLLVSDGWVTCVLPGCSCPLAEGQAFDANTSLVAATMTARGVVAMPSYRAILGLVEPNPQAQAAIERILADLPAGRAGPPDLLDTCLRHAAGGGVLTDRQAAQLGAALRHETTRKAAWRATDGEVWQRDLWLDLSRRMPDSHAGAPAALAAWSAWRGGNKKLAFAAADRARAADPDDHMTHLVARVLLSGIRARDVAWPSPPRDVDPPSP
ncbi:DUF4192 family protein [Actinoplanes sp. NPDC051859]|uniref:DUF4192 family protein n=1 Tax=Actinoplanes sp. NPDC051859 TaxID=3363909 RepID=UPI0037AF2A09